MTTDTPLPEEGAGAPEPTAAELNPEIKIAELEGRRSRIAAPLAIVKIRPIFGPSGTSNGQLRPSCPGANSRCGACTISRRRWV